MGRAALVIALAIICGISAAFGALQLANRVSEVKSTPVFVAAKSIRRGAAITEADIKVVQWPSELVPAGLVADRNEITSRSALTSITAEEPFFAAKLSSAPGTGFASNAIPKGMRACTIQTSGPSASVAGFVRPGDRVDVLLNLQTHGQQDETGGGSTMALLQAVEILAIDDILDVDSATMKMWVKDGLASVTLLVTPEQAMQLSLGQSAGKLSLALRNGTDTAPIGTEPINLRDINHPPIPLGGLAAAGGMLGSATDAVKSFLATGQARPGSSPTASEDEETAEQAPAAPPPPPPSFIRTLRGSQPGQIRVIELAGSRG
jgi:pilus assembly protein CpaB